MTFLLYFYKVLVSALTSRPIGKQLMDLLAQQIWQNLGKLLRVLY